MDRFCWSDGKLQSEDIFITRQAGVRLYDGDNKTAFDRGEVTLTSHRLLWRDHGDQRCVLELHLSSIVFMEVEPAGFGRSGKIVLHLNVPSSDKKPGPVTSSQYNFMKLAFKDGGQVEVHRCLQDEVARKRWQTLPSQTSTTRVASGGVRAAGIVGIERKIQQKQKETDKNISMAFEDLDRLMDKAKDMVSLSKSIANKIRDRQGDITEDETVKFKSYLLSMGIADPVTRETHGSGNKYFKELAKQLSNMLEQSLKESGGIMTLTDVYCRVNRARGMELLSPEDLVNACRQLDSLGLPVRLRVFDSGVMVLQLLSHSEEALIKQTKGLVHDNTSLTAEELSHLVGVSVVLAKERLLLAEKVGALCRDDCVEGLRYYPNLFTEKVS